MEKSTTQSSGEPESPILVSTEGPEPTTGGTLLTGPYDESTSQDVESGNMAMPENSGLVPDESQGAKKGLTYPYLWMGLGVTFLVILGFSLCGCPCACCKGIQCRIFGSKVSVPKPVAQCACCMSRGIDTKWDQIEPLLKQFIVNVEIVVKGGKIKGKYPLDSRLDEIYRAMVEVGTYVAKMSGTPIPVEILTTLAMNLEPAVNDLYVGVRKVLGPETRMLVHMMNKHPKEFNTFFVDVLKALDRTHLGRVGCLCMKELGGPRNVMNIMSAFDDNRVDLSELVCIAQALQGADAKMIRPMVPVMQRGVKRGNAPQMLQIFGSFPEHAQMRVLGGKKCNCGKCPACKDPVMAMFEEMLGGPQNGSVQFKKMIVMGNQGLPGRVGQMERMVIRMSSQQQKDCCEGCKCGKACQCQAKKQCPCKCNNKCKNGCKNNCPVCPHAPKVCRNSNSSRSDRCCSCDSKECRQNGCKNNCPKCPYRQNPHMNTLKKKADYKLRRGENVDDKMMADLEPLIQSIVAGAKGMGPMKVKIKVNRKQQ